MNDLEFVTGSDRASSQLLSIANNGPVVFNDDGTRVEAKCVKYIGH